MKSTENKKIIIFNVGNNFVFQILWKYKNNFLFFFTSEQANNEFHWKQLNSCTVEELNFWNDKTSKLLTCISCSSQNSGWWLNNLSALWSDPPSTKISGKGSKKDEKSTQDWLKKNWSFVIESCWKIIWKVSIL